jgi:hypothetical protein
MRLLIQRILLIISILFFLQSYLCQQEQHFRVRNNNTLLSNKTLTIGKLFENCSYIFFSHLDNALTEDSLNNSLIRTKYTTDEEDYTSIESIVFSIRTNQQISQVITILAGLTYENINYLFNIEVCFDLNKQKKKK